jgi:hypothetical protein
MIGSWRAAATRAAFAISPAGRNLAWNPTTTELNHSEATDAMDSDVLTAFRPPKIVRAPGMLRRTSSRHPVAIGLDLIASGSVEVIDLFVEPSNVGLDAFGELLRCRSESVQFDGPHAEQLRPPVDQGLQFQDSLAGELAGPGAHGLGEVRQHASIDRFRL